MMQNFVLFYSFERIISDAICIQLERIRKNKKNLTFMECVGHIYENQTSRMGMWNMRAKLFMSRKIIFQLLFRSIFHQFDTELKALAPTIY